MKYLNEPQLFAKKLTTIMIDKKMIDKRGKPDKIALYNLLNPNAQITENDCEIDRQGVTDKTRAISNWLNGKNYPKSIFDVISLCNALDCDLDYFFTDMLAPTHDINFITQETNLSYNAILNLQKTTDFERSILDILLKKEYFRDICFSIYSYMQTYYKEILVQDKDTGDRKLQDTEKMEIAEYRASKHFSHVLVNKIAKDEEIQKFNKYEHGIQILNNLLTTGQFRERLIKAETLWKESGLSFNEICDLEEQDNNIKESDD